MAADYDIDSDGDLNKYEADDIEDLTLTNVGEAFRGTAGWIYLIVGLLMIAFVIGIALKLKNKGSNALK